MAQLSEVFHRETGLLFICLQPNFKEASLNLRFLSRNMHGKTVNEFLFYEEIYRVPHVLFSGHELICFRINRDKIFVCNPHTHEARVLPRGTGDLQCLGFSYLVSLKEYIVVRVFKIQDKRFSDFSTGVEVMKLGENSNFVGFGSSWKKSRNSYDFNIIDYSSGGIEEAPMVERNMHWFVRGVPNCILSYDIEDDNLYTIDIPLDLDRSYASFCVLLALNGKLCMAGIDGTKNTPILSIWALVDRVESLWVAEYRIKFDDLEYEFLKDDNFYFEKLYPSNLDAGELVFGAQGIFYIYNIEKRSFKKVKGPEGCFGIGLLRMD